MDDTYTLGRLTGEIRYRPTWRGKLVLQVRQRAERTIYAGGSIERQPGWLWRDARTEDLPLPTPPAIEGKGE